MGRAEVRGEREWPPQAGVLTAPGTASAVSGADNDTSQRCAPDARPRAVEGVEILSTGWGAQNKSVPGGGGATHRDSWCCR